MDLIRESVQHEVFLDLDGVITDFEKQLLDMTGIKDPRSWEAKHGKEAFWSKVDALGEKFWSKMPWTPDGKKLWNYLNSRKGVKLTILTKPAQNPVSKTGKIRWIMNNLGPVSVMFSGRGPKGKHAKPGRILIDDQSDNTNGWKSNKGTAILHTSAGKTISELKKLGI